MTLSMGTPVNRETVICLRGAVPKNEWGRVNGTTHGGGRGLRRDGAVGVGRREVARVAPFVRGPLDWTWLCQSFRLSRGALVVGLAVWRMAGLRGRRTDLPISLHGLSRQSGIGRLALRQGLAALEAAGLAHVHRAPRRAPRVTLVVSTDTEG